jgi:hypothetical protein
MTSVEAMAMTQGFHITEVLMPFFQEYQLLL